jgi:hypothetical protein
MGLAEACIMIYYDSLPISATATDFKKIIDNVARANCDHACSSVRTTGWLAAGGKKIPKHTTHDDYCYYSYYY